MLDLGGLVRDAGLRADAVALDGLRVLDRTTTIAGPHGALAAVRRRRLVNRHIGDVVQIQTEMAIKAFTLGALPIQTFTRPGGTAALIRLLHQGQTAAKFPVTGN